jgi:DNA-binding Xre family transcriptional regulator
MPESEVAGTRGSPQLSLPEQSLRAQEVKAAIQRQYLIAAERGEISKIRAWRVLRGLDQNQLGSRAGMTQPEISRAERVGQVKKMKGETLLRIAHSLQVRVDDLF